MKKIIVVFMLALFIRQMTQAQGTLYLSNLGQPSTGSLAVGSDSWLAAGFQTGNAATGYTLNSIQLRMIDASGNPNGFIAMLYANSGPAGISPGTSLGTLNGYVDPSTTGIYTYTPGSSLMLSPHTIYFIVLTSETAVANGNYNWSYASGNSYNPSGGWFSLGGGWASDNGSAWNGSTAAFSQFAITATPVPEPSSIILLGLSGLLLLGISRWKAKAVQ